MLLFHKTTFDFSQESKNWILDRYKNHFNKNFYHNLDLDQRKLQYEWREVSAGKELLDYLLQYNCDTSNLIITAHLANLENQHYGRPHVDKEKQQIVTTRFNILIKGNAEDPMFWWTDFHYTDSRLYTVTQISTRTGLPFKGLTMPGTTIAEKMEYLGPATLTESNLLTPSAFVRTDYVHNIQLSPGPRLVITVGLNKTIEELIN
jgi:hypothetical protein